MPPNDDDPAIAADSDPDAGAHGRAALLLVESLIHGLCERAMLPTRAAVEIVERAAEAQLDEADDTDTGDAALRRAHDLLQRIAASLRIDDQEPSPETVPA